MPTAIRRRATTCDTLGSTLRAFRERKKLSIYRVAGNAEMSTSVVHNAENNENKRWITFECVRRIVEDGMKVDMVEFISEWQRAQRKSRKVAA